LIFLWFQQNVGWKKAKCRGNCRGKFWPITSQANDGRMTDMQAAMS